jgi:hypothetical protein
MNSIAHARPGHAPPRDPAGPHRAALHAAVPADARSLRERLRHPFARRAPTVASLIRKHRLWPALELVHDELVREFGSVRIEMTTSNPAEEFKVVFFDAYLPGIEAEHVVELEEALSEQVTERFGRATSLRLLVTLHSDPNHLPLFA